MSVNKVKGGYKNVSKSGKTFSRKPLTKAKAMKQLRAIEFSKHHGK